MARKSQIPNKAQHLKKEVLHLEPEMIKILQQGLSSHQSGQLSLARAAYEQVLLKHPKNYDALYLLGVVATQTKNPALAAELISKAIEINPNPDAFYNLGTVFQELKRLDDALASYDKAIALEPNFADAFCNRSTVLQELKRLEDALASFDRAISLKPDSAEAFYNRGTILQELNRLDDALASYDKAIALDPDSAKAFNNRGNVLQELKRLDDALTSYEKAIALKPDSAKAFNNRGNILKKLNRLDDALASYEKAIALEPNFAEAFNNHGNILKKLNRLDDALVSYEKAIALKPDYEFLMGTKLHIHMHLCDWKYLQNQILALEASISENLKVTTPFVSLGLTDKPELHLKVSRIYVDAKYPALGASGDFKSRPPDGKIRIGYYSADFHNHATSLLMAELFEVHDAQKFELYGFSFGPDQHDEMRSRISSGFHHFMDVTQKSDREVAQISRDLGIDIAVDLKGFTQDSRMGIFAEKCAPIQINYLGYPGTLAAPYFDYIVADKILIPQESKQFYTEKIIYLPHSYQVNDSKRKNSEIVFTRKELGLPEQGFVFCCFNNNYKILPEIFEVWMRLLKMVEGSVLWLLENNPKASMNLRKEAEVRGVDSARIVFAPRMKLENHLARHRVADLFIDTLPYNAHTTASDALWAGLPILTQLGQSFAARVAASLLYAMDLPELVTKTQQEYEARAIELASNPKLQIGRAHV